MKIKLHKDARKYLSRLTQKSVARILNAIGSLPEGDVAPLKGRHPKMRLRIGEYRVIFEYFGDIVYVLEIGNRGDVYK